MNPYRKLIVNNAEKIDTVLSQMEQWSILGNVVKYIKYDNHPKNFHNQGISGVLKEKGKGKSNLERRETFDGFRFWRHTREIKGRVFTCVQRNTIRNIKHYQV